LSGGGDVAFSGCLSLFDGLSGCFWVTAGVGAEGLLAGTGMLGAFGGVIVGPSAEGWLGPSPCSSHSELSLFGPMTIGLLGGLFLTGT